MKFRFLAPASAELDDAVAFYEASDEGWPRPPSHRTAAQEPASQLSATGNPSMDNLAAIFEVLRRNLRMDIAVHAA